MVRSNSGLNLYAKRQIVSKVSWSGTEWAENKVMDDKSIIILKEFSLVKLNNVCLVTVWAQYWLFSKKCGEAIKGQGS